MRLLTHSINGGPHSPLTRASIMYELPNGRDGVTGSGKAAGDTDPASLSPPRFNNNTDVLLQYYSNLAAATALDRISRAPPAWPYLWPMESSVRPLATPGMLPGGTLAAPPPLDVQAYLRRMTSLTTRPSTASVPLPPAPTLAAPAAIPIPPVQPSYPDDDDTPKNRKRPQAYESWNAMFERLLIYKQRHGDCLVPHRYKDDPKLGRWVERQRRNRKRDSLPDSRVDRLDQVGFEWSVRDKSVWDTMFMRLCHYKEQHGDCCVPTKYPPDPKLGNWVQTQRQCQDNLTEERRRRLDGIEFAWSLREKWNCMFERLQEFKEKHGHCQVPPNYKDDDSKLGLWVSIQRTRETKLSLKRKERLDSIGFLWHVKDPEGIIG